MDRIVVVGASLAGLRAVEALRREGFGGHLTLVGAEPHLPYDRPPLSKELLTGEWDHDRVVLRKQPYDELDLELRLGVRAVGLELGARTVALADGGLLPFDGAVIATGATPRRLPGLGDLEGIRTLRTLEDSATLRADLERGARLCIVGAGFIGAEVAAAARARGLEVTVLEAAEQPMARVLGDRIGAALAADPMQLPLANQSVDLLALPHALESTADPHLVLREAERVLGVVEAAGLEIYGAEPVEGRAVHRALGVRRWQLRAGLLQGVGEHAQRVDEGVGAALHVVVDDEQPALGADGKIGRAHV
mgnify:CR=1 FL=1